MLGKPAGTEELTRRWNTKNELCQGRAAQLWLRTHVHLGTDLSGFLVGGCSQATLPKP